MCNKVGFIIKENKGAIKEKKPFYALIYQNFFENTNKCSLFYINCHIGRSKMKIKV